MFNFRNLIPWPCATDYQKLSKEMYQVSQQIKQEQRKSTMPNSAGFTVGVASDGGAVIVFKGEGGFTTNVELSAYGVRKLIALLEVAIDTEDELDPSDLETDAI